MKIATHNSGTGESGGGILSFLGSPFSKCQSKTIIEQYNYGVRLFDLRVRKYKDKWVFAHGLWHSKTSIFKVLNDLNNISKDSYILVTYEGKIDNSFLDIVEEWFKIYSNLNLVEVAIKKPKWKVLKSYKRVPYKQHFKVLDGRSWHTYLPIPWLWKKLYYKEPKFNNTTYTMVDFI
jgi:hypothetical protein